MYCCCLLLLAAAAAQAAPAPAPAPATWVTHARVAAGAGVPMGPQQTQAGRSKRATWRVGRTQGRHREAYAPLSRELDWVWRLLACLRRAVIYDRIVCLVVDGLGLLAGC
jgi:hypothetical protein